jgi:hypothetical protein
MGDLGELFAAQGREHGGEIVFDGHTQAATGLDHRKDRGDLGAGVRTAHVQPVLAVMYKCA